MPFVELEVLGIGDVRGIAFGIRPRCNQRRRTLHVHRQLSQITMPVGPQQFCDGRFSATGSGVDRVESAHRVGAHHAQSDPRAGDLFANVRILVTAIGFRQVDDAWSSRANPICCPSVDTPRSKVSSPPSRSSSPRRVPPDHQIGIGDGVVEEDLVELRCAGELLNGPNCHTGLIQRDQQEAQPPLVTLGAHLGAADHEAPLRDVSQ